MERILVLMGTIFCALACLLVLLAHAGNASSAGWVTGSLGYGGAALIGLGVLLRR